MVRAGNDPRQMIGVFDMLNSVSQAGGGGRVPEWLATHPNPVNRSADFQKEIDTLKLNSNRLTVNQDSYLSRINGVVFGQNPREGFFRDNHFYQPDLEFEFESPSGWQTVNQERGRRRDQLQSGRSAANHSGAWDFQRERSQTVFRAAGNAAGAFGDKQS